MARRVALLRALILALLISLPAAAAPLDATPKTRLDADLRCLLGTYAFLKGEMVTITGAGGHPRNFRYTLVDGRFGTLRAQGDGVYAADAFTIKFATCDAGRLQMTKADVVENGRRLALIERETTFESDKLRLHGKLVLPASGLAKALAVWIEGSNNNASTDDTVWQYELARRGVAVFVYDKRGTGSSAGEPTADFFARARDTAAAVSEARRLAPQIRRVGVIGGSQGGWVAPLVATLTPLDFVVPAFALAVSPIVQDQELVQLQLQQAGFDKDVLAKARELTAITERIVRSNMVEGLPELEAFKTQNAGAAWLRAIQPRSYTGVLVQLSSADIRAFGPAATQGLSFGFEPKPVIETIKPRQLWLLGGKDQQAPNQTTLLALKEIQSKRADVSVIVFPNADHGLVESFKTKEGDRMRFAPRLFDVTANWIKNGELPNKGTMIIMEGK
jgi:uncharacterized protein